MYYIVFCVLTLPTATIGLECAGIIIIVVINNIASLVPNIEKKCKDMTDFE